jgi:hypothetical protein
MALRTSEPLHAGTTLKVKPAVDKTVPSSDMLIPVNESKLKDKLLVITLSGKVINGSISDNE